MTKWNYIFGVVTITVIVGGTIYAIKKSKDADKAEEESISVEEAMAMVARERANKDSIKFEQPIEVERPAMHYESEDQSVYKAGVKSFKASEMPNEDEIEYEEGMEELGEDDPLRDDYPLFNEFTEAPTIEPLEEFYFEEEGIDPKEDKELRYPPNSPEAKHQFIRMELASWNGDHTIYRIMLQLFEIPLIPTTVGDETLRTKIIDYKAQFFGITSKWVREVSMADVIFHYAREAEFNCGEFVAYWVEYFLDFQEFHWESTTLEIETLCLRLNTHAYFNEERQTFGLFGLTRESMDQAIRIASGNVERSVTFEIEFQEFLKSCL